MRKENKPKHEKPEPYELGDIGRAITAFVGAIIIYSLLVFWPF